MFELKIKIDFPAGHNLVGYEGDCARPHGHNWELELFVRSRALDKVGMAVDFRLMKKAAKELVSRWDHQNLNELEEFRHLNPTAENLAKIAFERLSTQINAPSDAGPWVDRVTVWENPRCSATYMGEVGRG